MPETNHIKQIYEDFNSYSYKNYKVPTILLIGRKAYLELQLEVRLTNSLEYQIDYTEFDPTYMGMKIVEVTKNNFIKVVGY